MLIFFCVFYAALIVLAVVEKKTKKLLSDDEKEVVKNIIPVHVWLPSVIALTRFPIFFIGSINYQFLLLVELTLALFLGTGIWSYRFWKTNSLELPIEYLEKAKNLNLAYSILNFVSLVGMFSLIFTEWKTNNFEIFLSPK